MKRLFTFFAATMSAVLMWTSCTIKEDRGPCPCFLDIYLENAAEFSKEALLTGWSAAGDGLYRVNVDVHDYEGSYYETTVPKGFNSSCALLGATLSRVQGNRVIIPFGRGCDHYYAHCHENIDCTGEFAEDHLQIHKQYAMLYLQTSTEMADFLGDLRFVVIGEVNGMTLDTLSPTQGEFRCEAVLNENGNWEICLPRQLDDTLRLEVYDGSGKLYATYELGRMIARTNYSWAKLDLDDIYLTIDLNPHVMLKLSINDWDTKAFTFVI